MQVIDLTDEYKGLIDGKGLFFIPCIWVHGHKKGRGNFQKRGMGKALLQAAERDAKERGARGLVAWGMSLPFFMRASWFKKQGYKKEANMCEQDLLPPTRKSKREFEEQLKIEDEADLSIHLPGRRL